MAKSLSSALSSLQAWFADDAEKLHLAVAAVFSSIFLAHGIPVVVVGGQAAAWWLRVTGSRDVDLVSSDFERVRDALQLAGLRITDPQMRFRLVHPGQGASSSVLVELVGEHLQVAGIRSDSTSVSTIEPDSITDRRVRALMCGPGLVIEPCLTFLNYADACRPSSDWYDHEDEGSLAFERATALLVLYRPHILTRLRWLASKGDLSAELLSLLSQRFGLMALDA